MAKLVKFAAIGAAIFLAPVTGGASLLGLSALAATAIVAGLTIGASLLAGKPKAPRTSPANTDRLNATIELRAPRKIVFGGPTAMATDIR